MRKMSVVLVGTAFLAGTALPSLAQDGQLLLRNGPGGGGGGGPQRGSAPVLDGAPRNFNGGPRNFNGGAGGGPRGMAAGGGPRPDFLRPGGPGRDGPGFGGRRFGGVDGGPRDGDRHRFGDGRRFRGGYGAAIGAGAAGFAAGALLGGSRYGYGYGYGYGDPGYGYYNRDDEDDAPVYGGDAEVADAAPVTGDGVAYCQRRYRSYDVSSGTYLGYDGLRHPCP